LLLHWQAAPVQDAHSAPPLPKISTHPTAVTHVSAFLLAGATLPMYALGHASGNH